MKCYNCGCDLSENEFCTACGADVSVYKKIVLLSNKYYNDGLLKAQVRDLSGAVDSLKQSLKCNKFNTDARNLLGLVYFEMGEAVDALSEWVISKNFQPKKNIADDFIASVQNNPTKWDGIRQTIRKYNQALDYCRQGDLDLAAIQLKALLKMNNKIVKGHQLLALLYIYEEKYERAKKCCLRALRIDTNNTTALYYLKEIEAAIRKQDEMDPEAARRRKKKPSTDVIEYVSGNETIIQPLNSPDRSFGSAIVINILIGLVLGMAIMWFLILPSRIKASQAEANNDVVEISNQLTEKSTKIDELEKQIASLEEDKKSLEESMQSYTGGNGFMEACDSLMDAARQYIHDPDDAISVAESLENIDQQYLNVDDSSVAFTQLYTYLKENAGKKASKSYLKEGKNSYTDKNYEDAIDKFTKAIKYDADNVEALLNLAHAYRLYGDEAKAKRTYSQLVSLFPNTDYADEARNYVDDADIAAFQSEQSAAPETEDVAPGEDGGDGDQEDGEGQEASQVTTQNPTEETVTQ